METAPGKLLKFLLEWVLTVMHEMMPPVHSNPSWGGVWWWFSSISDFALFKCSISSPSTEIIQKSETKHQSERLRKYTLSISMAILNQFYAGFDRGLLNQKSKIKAAVPVELNESQNNGSQGKGQSLCIALRAAFLCSK